MSTNESTSSRGTRSRSRSRSRSPPGNNGRYPPRYSGRYESYGYRSRTGMTAAIDDYWELRDRERERERDRSMLMIRDERYGRGRYSSYYRDEPPPSHHGSSHTPRDYGKPPSLSSPTTLRPENSHERTPPQQTKPKDDSSSNSCGNKPGTTTTTTPTTTTFDYSSRYSDWREREWDRDRDRDRDRRYRDEDRRREFERRNRDRDSYMIRDPRFDTQGYVGGPSISGYPPPPFGRDSYRPGGRDREPSSPGTHPYYDRDLYRPVSSRGSSIDLDQYRNSRVSRPVVENSGSSSGGASTNGRWRDREWDSSEKSILDVIGPTSSSSSSSISKDDSKSTDTKLDNINDTGDRNSGHDMAHDAQLPGESYTTLATNHFVGTLLPDKYSGENELNDLELPEKVEKYENHPKESLQQNPTPKTNSLRIDVPLPMKNSSPSPLSLHTPCRSPATIVLPSSSSSSGVNFASSLSESLPSHLKSNSTSENPNTQSTTSCILPPENIVKTPATSLSTKTYYGIKSEPILTSSTTTTAKTKVETKQSYSATSTLKLAISTYPNSSTPNSMDDAKENLEPNVGNHINREPVMSQQQIVARIDEIENSITKYEEMLEQLNKREAHSKRNEQQKENWQQQSEGSSSPIETKHGDNDTDEETVRKLTLQAIGTNNNNNQQLVDIQNNSFIDASSLRKRPQLLMDQIRTNDDPVDDALVNIIISTNRNLVKKNSNLIGGWHGDSTKDDEWWDETKWMAPLYGKLQDYPCYKENMATFDKLKGSMAPYLASRGKQLKQKERQLKREFKEIYCQWKDKNIALDRIRLQQYRGPDRCYSGGGSGYKSSTRRTRGVEEEPEEYVDGVIFTGNHDALRFGTDGANTSFGRVRGKGGWTSDAARSEAELLEIIQSLESAEMRNPELRAAKTTATIPPMILDTKVRTQTYDDRNGLVEDPLAYYHTGTETEDLWSQQEMTAFMESYMQYPKQFDKISVAVGTKSAPQCVLFYYRKKTKIDFKALMRKGKRGKSKKRERLAAAIRRATGDTSTNTRSGKSKGSALMADIGQAQVSRKAKEKESETKSKELRELEEANAYWDGVAERRKAKRPPSNSASTSRGGNDDSVSTATTEYSMKRRLGKRKGRSPRSSVTSIPNPDIIFPDELADETTFTSTTATMISTSKPSKQQHQIHQRATSHSPGHPENMTDGADQHESNSVNVATAKWTDHDKHAAAEAFKQHGRDFVKVSEMMGNKTDDQCRNFYFNHKRKFGSNVFGEEANDQLGTNRPTSAPTSKSTFKINTSIQSPDISLAAKIERPDLKAEEEDAAAALVGLFQMGGSRDHSLRATPSPSLSSSSVSFLTGDMAPTLPSKYVTTSHQPQQIKGRRRARTTSGKMDTIVTQDSWIGEDLAAPGNSSTIGKRTTPDIKRGSNSSYWSVSERSEFVHYLELYGRDWTKIADAMTTKTMIQVRNFYQNNEAKLKLDKVLHRHEGVHSTKTTSLLQSPHYNNPSDNNLEVSQQQIMPPMGTSFDNHIPSSSISSIRSQCTSVPHLSSPQTTPYDGPKAVLPQHLSFGKQGDMATYNSSSSSSEQRPSYFNSLSSTSLSSSSIPRFTQPAPKDYPLYQSTDTASYSTNYGNSSNSTSDHITSHLPQHHRRPQSAPSNHNIRHIPLATSPTGVTKVSDLLNSNDEPAETNTQNSWETWFGP